MIDAGGASTCGITTEGRGYCWGDTWGSAGAGTPHGPTPVELPGGHRWVAIDVGNRGGCGLTRDGAAYCWGAVDGLMPTAAFRYGELRLVAPNPGLVRITTGDDHACGLTQDGTAYCWGRPIYGQLGRGFVTDLSEQPPGVVAGGLHFTELRAGIRATCGLVAAGDLYCWGGTSTQGDAVTPRPVQRGLGFATFHLGGPMTGHYLVCGTLAPTVGGGVGCAQYVPPERAVQPPPKMPTLPAGLAISTVDAGGAASSEIDPDRSTTINAHGCALDSEGSVWCWGTTNGGWAGLPDGWLSNAYGQLGDGTVTDRTVPVRVTGLPIVVGMTTGGAHTCALTAAGVAYCWGANTRGQLGVAITKYIGLPQRVPAPPTLP